MDPNWDYYLFVTPPLQKITSKNWGLSLNEFECVPSGIFYFALTDRGNHNELFNISLTLLFGKKDLEAKIKKFVHY